MCLVDEILMMVIVYYLKYVMEYFSLFYDGVFYRIYYNGSSG